MNEYSLTRLYELLKQDLVSWIAGNPKVKSKITSHNLNFLFEFHKKNGLSIDLTRLDKDYYLATFYPPEANQELITDFVKKAIAIMCVTLKRIGMEDISITIVGRNKVSEVSYWRSCYLRESSNPNKMSPLMRKMDDWQ